MDEREQINQGEAREPAPERTYRREQTAGSDSIAQAKRVIDLIEQKLSEGRRIPLSKGMAVVSVDEIGNLISQLRIALPKTVLQAQEIMQRSQQIMEDARRAAEETAN